MGRRGPVPKRTEDLRGNITKERLHGGTKLNTTSAPGFVLKANQPQGKKEWSDSAKIIWRSLPKSAQSATFEHSDWSVARALMTDVTEYQNFGQRNSQKLASLANGFSGSLLTEGSRRRRGVELEVRDVPVKPTPASPDPKWHEDAIHLWKAVRKSDGIIAYYEPSDWAVLRFLCHEWSQYRNAGSASGQMHATLTSIMADLMLTEGTRRVLNLELATAKAVVTSTPGQEEAKRWHDLLTKEGTQ